MKQIKSVLSGKEINLTGDNTTITSTNFNVDRNGNMSCSNANITNGKVILGSPLSGEGNAVLRVYSGNSGPSTEIYPNSVEIFQENPYSRAYFGIYQGNVSFQLMDEESSETKGRAGSVNFWGPGGTGGTYVGYDKIETPTLTQTSLESQKKNFKKMQDNALEILKQIDIYKYNLKNEKDTDKKHIGFVIGDNYNYSKEVTSLDNTGVDNYAFTSLCCKAIQEQQEMIEQLQEKMKEMEDKLNETN